MGRKIVVFGVNATLGDLLRLIKLSFNQGLLYLPFIVFRQMLDYG
jgi:hypothetical protein